jgi:uncharacterized protein (DUF111 family)
MSKATIYAGVCGFTTVVNAEKSGRNDVSLKITSDCPAYKDLDEKLSQVNAMTCSFNKVGTGQIYEVCQQTCKHGACPVPAGIIKAVEIAGGLALPKNVTISLEK